MVVSGSARTFQKEIAEIQIKVRSPEILAGEAPDLMIEFARAKLLPSSGDFGSIEQRYCRDFLALVNYSPLDSHAGVPCSMNTLIRIVDEGIGLNPQFQVLCESE